MARIILCGAERVTMQLRDGTRGKIVSLANYNHAAVFGGGGYSLNHYRCGIRKRGGLYNIDFGLLSFNGAGRQMSGVKWTHTLDRPFVSEADALSILRDMPGYRDAQDELDYMRKSRERIQR